MVSMGFILSLCVSKYLLRTLQYPFIPFIYSEESHNSVIGMREYALQKGASFHTIDTIDLDGKDGYNGLRVSDYTIYLH